MQSLRVQSLPRVVVLFAALFAPSDLLAAGPSTPARKLRISIELVTEANVPLTASQQWNRALGDLGLSGVRIRSATGDEKAEIEQVGTAAEPAYRVTGILTADNVLVVPGGKFGVRDTGKLRKWLDALGDQGVKGVTQPKLAFGLLLEQWERFHDDLQKPVTVATKGVPLSDVVGKIGRQLAFPLLLDPSVGRAMADVVVEDDLKGISRGTALAMMLRPAGLAFEPERQTGGKMQYRVRKAQATRQNWPIGWLPSQPQQKVLPESFDSINVEFKDVALPEVLQAIAGRLKTPFLFDHTALAAEKIDPAKVDVNLPAKRLAYVVILQKVLMKARLKPELRLDEADKPFFWITTVKPLP